MAPGVSENIGTGVRIRSEWVYGISRNPQAHLHHRKLTFKRRRDLIEEALARAGAEKQPSGIWMRKVAEEDVA